MKTQEELLTSNIFNLRFLTDTFENQYQDELSTKQRSSNTNLFKFNFFFSLSLIIIILVAFKAEITSKETLGLFIPLFLIAFVRLIDRAYSKANNTIQASIGVVYFFIYSIFIIATRKVLIELSTLNALLLVIWYYFDLTSKLIIICSQLIDHNKFCKVNLLLAISTQLINFKFKRSNETVIYWILENALILIEIYFSNWINKNERYTFYCVDKVYTYLNWYRDLLNSINTSFLKVLNGDVLFINTHFIQVLIQLGAIDQEERNDMAAMIKKSNQILKAMFTTMEFNKEIVDNETKAKAMEANFDEFKENLLKKLKNLLFNHKGSSDFISFIGYFTLEEKNTSRVNYAFECYCRYEPSELGEGFEFIFNNVTRTKILEEKNTEFRVKTTFLSKVTHEFKNPLICLSEIIDEQVNSNVVSKENCLTIKSISNYLLILIKNIDFFSQMQFQLHTQSAKELDHKTNNGNKLNMIQCCLNDIFDFITLISDYLIKKKKSEKLLKFTIANKTRIQFIDTDEVKLKQLLINLISNAIKFTYKGAITLTVSEENKLLRFSVRDTGIGIPDALKEELFNPFSKSKRQNDLNNMLGTGLGLSIAKELACALGAGLNFESTIGIGTVFWFDLEFDATEDEEEEETKSNISISSLMTLKGEIISPISFSIQCSPHQNFTLLITDDDSVLRQSSIKILKRFADLANINLEIIEACDGLELLWKYYDNTMKNKHIDIILSDEDMLFYSGNKAAKELSALSQIIGSTLPKFFILSSNEFTLPYSNYINGYYKKPLVEENMHEIFSFENLRIY